ncbi:hypothetical protein KSS87_006307 [Heliosperma pusillum]|nr:hypothetical protein KSS87_006307 [Heliosperma pusillum]
MSTHRLVLTVFLSYILLTFASTDYIPKADDKDVIVHLKGRNFTHVVNNNNHVVVQFYAPWCSHCKTLAPEYSSAAMQLKADGVDVVFAKVDATEDIDLAHQYGVQGFPTVYFFVDGGHKRYSGSPTRDAIVTWIKKKTGSGVYNLTTADEAQKILTSYEKVVLAFLNSLTGPESAELASAARLEDDVNFYQTVNPNIAKLFKIDTQAKRPALVLLKKEVEKVTYFDGEFTKPAIAEFVFANKHPLITAFTKHNAALIFQSQIKKQLLLFATSKNSALVLPIFTQAAKLFKGKIMFVYVRLDRDDVSKIVASYLGVTESAPKVIAYTVHEDSGKFILDGEVTLEKLKAFGDDFLQDKLINPLQKSDPIPETNDGDVKIVVGDNFDQIVLDESKDVLLQIYAPGCDRCQSLEPIYNKLAQHLRSIESIVIAKMDGTTNKHPRAKVIASSDEFPTIVFFPAGNKNLDPLTVDTDYTLMEVYKFLKKNAAIPFKLQKSTSSPKDEL